MHGAAGGVGTATIQVAKGYGARTIAVVSTEAKAEVARAGRRRRGGAARRVQGRRRRAHRRPRRRRRGRRGRRRRLHRLAALAGHPGPAAGGRLRRRPGHPRGEGQPAAAQQRRRPRRRLGRLRDGAARLHAASSGGALRADGRVGRGQAADRGDVRVRGVRAGRCSTWTSAGRSASRSCGCGERRRTGSSRTGSASTGGRPARPRSPRGRTWRSSSTSSRSPPRCASPSSAGWRCCRTAGRTTAPRRTPSSARPPSRSAGSRRARSRTPAAGGQPVPGRDGPGHGVDRVVLPSPNGSSISFGLADRGCAVVGACLRNRAAVARWLRARGGTVAVVAAGERWPDDSLRPAAEDLWGAGAVLALLDDDALSPEARLAADAFRVVEPTLADACAPARAGSSWPRPVRRGRRGRGRAGRHGRRTGAARRGVPAGRRLGSTHVSILE